MQTMCIIITLFFFWNYRANNDTEIFGTDRKHCCNNDDTLHGNNKISNCQPRFIVLNKSNSYFHSQQIIYCIHFISLNYFFFISIGCCLLAFCCCYWTLFTSHSIPKCSKMFRIVFVFDFMQLNIGAKILYCHNLFGGMRLTLLLLCEYLRFAHNSGKLLS